MRKRFAIGLLAAAIVVGLVAASRHELLRVAIRAGAALAGYDVRVGLIRSGEEPRSARFASSAARAAFAGRTRHDRLFAARLLPGSGHRFGLVDVDASDVEVTFTRFAMENSTCRCSASRPRRPPRIEGAVAFSAPGTRR